MSLTIEEQRLFIANAPFLLEFDEKFYEFIEGYVREQVGKRQGWWTDEDCFGPENWPKYDEDGYKGLYQISFSGADLPWLYHASRYEDRGMGFALVVNQRTTKKSLEEFYNEHSDSLEGAEIVQCFGENKYYLFFPFQVNLEDIAKAYPNWQEAVKAPIDETLEKVFKAHAVIDPFVRELAEEE